MSFKLRIAFFIFFTFQFFSIVSGQDSTLYLTAESLKQIDETLRIERWKYHPGDDHNWANSDFNDSSWVYFSTNFSEDQLLEQKWPGIGWFRKQIFVDSSLMNIPLVLFVKAAGSAEVFIDGVLFYKTENYRSVLKKILGIPKQNYKIFSFKAETDHVIAVRYTNNATERFFNAGFGAGFSIELGLSNEIIDRNIDELTGNLRNQMFFVALTLAFVLLHLILFIYSPDLRSNLYYAVYLSFFALNIFFDYQHFLASNIQDDLLFLKIHRSIQPFTIIFMLRFVYSLFKPKLPKQFWILSLGLIVFGILAVIKPVDNFGYFINFTTIITLEIVRVIFLAIRDKKDGVWIITSGFLLLFLFSSYDALLDLNVISKIFDMENAYMFGMVGLFICTSSYLARDFAKRNEKIIHQERRTKKLEIEQRLLEAEDARKSKELEEARQLQLAMLPQCIDKIPGLDICFQMETATEVGGDYYDYHIAENGTLTLAIGDATGHGMKAGTMVSVVKSLFIADGSQSDIISFLNKCSATIKQMSLGNLYMALMLVRIKDQKMKIASAGMPPVLIYRYETKSIEEIIIKNMPLGADISLAHKEKEIKLAPGDSVLLMSDGFPELFNDKKELLDYDRVKEIFKETAELSSEKIVDHLFMTADKWRNGSPQNDDITFIVLKLTKS